MDLTHKFTYFFVLTALKVRFGEIQCCVREWDNTMLGPDEAFSNIVNDLLYDYDLQHLATDPEVDDICYKRLISSRTYQFAGDAMAPCRFISDHLKSPLMKSSWTERYWGFLLRAVFMKKVRPSAKVWKKIIDNRTMEAAEAAHAEADGAVQIAGKAEASNAKPFRSCFVFPFVVYLLFGFPCLLGSSVKI